MDRKRRLMVQQVVMCGRGVLYRMCGVWSVYVHIYTVTHSEKLRVRGIEIEIGSQRYASALALALGLGRQQRLTGPR